MSPQQPSPAHLAFAAGILSSWAGEFRQQGKPALADQLEPVCDWLMELAAADDHSPPTPKDTDP